MPVCAKAISSWERKFLSMARAHMSMGTVKGAATLAAGVSLMSVLQPGDWNQRFYSR